MKKLIKTIPVIAYLVLISCTSNSNQTTNNTNDNNNGTVTIGAQTWTLKNLNVTSYSDGYPIPEVNDYNAWSHLTTGAWCYYDGDPANGLIYGKLYNWYAVAGIYDAASLNNPALRKNLAPAGWHIPSDSEWTNLINYLGGSSVAGGKMKESGYDHWIQPNTSATNSSGFTGLPGSYRANDGVCYSFKSLGYWWTAKDNTHPISNLSCRYVGTNNGGIYSTFSITEAYGLSVRCVKD